MVGSNNGPSVRFRASTFQAIDDSQPSSSSQQQRPQRLETPGGRQSVESSVSRPTTPNVYHGSYGTNLGRNRASVPGSLDAEAPRGSVGGTPGASMSHVQLQHLLQAVEHNLDDYGIQEDRDGFFDASFFRPLNLDHAEMIQEASEALPKGFKKKDPLSLRRFGPQQWSEFLEIVKQITFTRAGIQLAKSFLGFFISYVICLVPASRNWLGRYNYIMVLSAIVNHAGRPLGSQIDGTILTILGTVAGLGWGSLALYVSTSTSPARSGYGGVLATFLILFTTAIAWLRCIYMRFFQAVIAAGIAICYTCLTETSGTVSWKKTFDYGIPWVLGQAVCILISMFVFPDTGAYAISIAFHRSLKSVQDGLSIPRPDTNKLKRDLSWHFVNLSEAVRDYTFDLSVSRFQPEDIRSMRNLVQGVIRAVLAIKPDTTLSDVADEVAELTDTNADGWAASDHNEALLYLIQQQLAKPTRALLEAMYEAIEKTDFVIMTIGGCKKPSSQQNPDIRKVLNGLRVRRDAFDAADASLTSHSNLPSTYSDRPNVVRLFLFVHPVRQAAEKIEVLLEKTLRIWEGSKGLRVWFPSYPFAKALLRCNAQVRHDRGGLTAGFYFQSKNQLERTMRELQSRVYVPSPRGRTTTDASVGSADQMPTIGQYEQEKKLAMGEREGVSRRIKLRFGIWEFLHSLQGFEARFAFKVALVATFISVPAWLAQSKGWWNAYESWWTVVTVWMMMHPRVGGTFQDLTVRVLYAIIGSLWAAFAFAADNGNPYVMAVFAAVFMVPMLHRYTQSSHPRSGIVGCISFTVISLGAYTEGGKPSIIKFAWTRSAAFIVGVVAAILVNWMLWPFVARHELRKSLSAMMLHCAILYRSVVAKYIYYTEGQEPGPKDVARSEILEGRLREGFVRIRQLMEMTRHEIRLRAPFDPLPYSALVDSCERFFDSLVQVRQSSLYFQPHMLARSPDAASSLTVLRRDAVAVILMNLYILACALRNDQPLPRYLPSAAAARQKLLDQMEKVEADQEVARVEEVRSGKTRRWADIYHYAYSSALTDIVERLQRLQRYTKEITGEVGFEDSGIK